MELKIALTENQAKVVLREFERIAESSEDAGYRVQAENICKRIRAAQQIVAADRLRNPPGCTCYRNDTLVYERCPIHGGG